jgi:hypothetical protein
MSPSEGEDSKSEISNFQISGSGYPAGHQRPVNDT